MPEITTKLKRNFFNRSAITVAQELLGQLLVFGHKVAIIIETEAYRGSDDPASHAYRGPSARSNVMFGKSGISYVYLIYGIYHCLNIVTEDIGSPSAVLIRGLKTLTDGVKIVNGPGKICQEMQITLAHNRIDLTQQEDFYIAEGNMIKDFYATPRIGIKAGTDKLWRFVAQGFYK